MKSTPRSREQLMEQNGMLPPPRGCARCLKVVPGLRDWFDHAITCNHQAHFDAIAMAFRERGIEELDSGSYRRCFVSKNGKWVYKVPGNSIGYVDNYFESCAWKDRKFFRQGGTPIGHRIARCRLHPSGVLVMELVQKARRYWETCAKIDPTLRDDPALYAITNIDGCQGGIARDGKFKLYDYTHYVNIDDPIPARMMAL